METKENCESLHIGFSHKYHKLHGQTSGTLLDARIVDVASMSQKLIEYDCAYEGGLFEFDDGIAQMLRLVFLGNEQIPFTTFRTVTDEHKERFLKNVGKEFTFFVSCRSTSG